MTIIPPNSRNVISSEVLDNDLLINILSSILPRFLGWKGNQRYSHLKGWRMVLRTLVIQACAVCMYVEDGDLSSMNPCPTSVPPYFVCCKCQLPTCWHILLPFRLSSCHRPHWRQLEPNSTGPWGYQACPLTPQSHVSHLPCDVCPLSAKSGQLHQQGIPNPGTPIHWPHLEKPHVLIDVNLASLTEINAYSHFNTK